jgi:TMEM175 potassium channel family protein
MAPRAAIFRTGPLSTTRVEAFSDGVLAVVITLLVLEVKLPSDLQTDTALWAAIRQLAPVLAAWAVSFAFVLTFWVSHHYFFASLKNTDRGLLWLNGLFLLTITLIPFPTGLVGQYPGFVAPLALLSGTMMLTSLSFALMRFYASFHSRLLQEHISVGRARTAMIQSGIAPVLYAAATGLCFVWPLGAIGLQVLVLAIFFIRTPSRHATPEESP